MWRCGLLGGLGKLSCWGCVLAVEVSQVGRSIEALLKLAAQSLHSFSSYGVGEDSGLGAAQGVHDSGVISATEVPPDCGKRLACELPC